MYSHIYIRNLRFRHKNSVDGFLDCLYIQYRKKISHWNLTALKSDVKIHKVLSKEWTIIKRIRYYSVIKTKYGNIFLICCFLRTCFALSRFNSRGYNNNIMELHIEIAATTKYSILESKMVLSIFKHSHLLFDQFFINFRN